MSQSLSALGRPDQLQRLGSEIFDLVIIGGGINGAGVARDAASRGMRVALIEARDYAVGTSSRSSKLIHGGIRYLENLEFGLVFEALSERRRLFEIAPHLVHPLRFVIPLYQGGRVGVFKMGLGMFLYDALALFETPEPAEHFSADEALELLPSLQRSSLMGAYAYSDAYMDDDRLVIETLRSAARFGACLANYVEAREGVRKDGKIIAVSAVDKLSGKSLTIRGRHFISTVGPWTDRVVPHLAANWQRRMRPSKGVHLTFSRERLPLAAAVVMAAEKRIVFAIPRHEMVIVGTTDTDYPGDPYEVKTERSDVSYLMSVVHKYFPGAQLSESDIVGSYAGVRPLVDDAAQTESQTSREHQIVSLAENLTVVMGGKYTTYRLIAEQTVDAALGAFQWEDQVRFARGRTTEPLNPLITSSQYGDKERWLRVHTRASNFAPELLAALFDRHGHEAEDILSAYAPGVDPGWDWPSQLWALEAAHAIHENGCLNLCDFFFRRTPLVLSDRRHGRAVLGPVREQFKAYLGLSDAELDNQVKSLDAEMTQALGWRTSP